MKQAEAISYDDNGDLVLDFSADAANADWIRAGRLKKLADEGDEEAAQLLQELEDTPMYYEENEP